MRDAGILLGYGLWIDPGVFDRQEALVFFKRNRTREEVVQALKARDVAYVGWKVDEGLTVGVWSKEPHRSIRELGLALGERPAGHAVTGAGDLPNLSVLDFMIMEALIDDPKISFEDLVDATRLSPKTVRRHLDALVRSETIVIVPRLGAAADSGELVYNLAVAGEASMSMIRAVLGDALLVHETRRPPMKYLLCRSTDLGDVTSKTRALQRLEGVKTAVVTLNRELLFSNEFIHSLVRDEIDKREETRSALTVIA